MKSDSILPEIKRQIKALSSKNKQPVAVKMSESTWILIAGNDLAVHFGDVDVNRRLICGLQVVLDNAFPIGYATVYVHYTTADTFTYA